MTLTTLLLSDTGQSLTCRVSGQGEPLVLIHGVGMQSAAWTPQIETLSRHYKVIAIDMPGHGGSAPLPKGSQLPDYVAWCAQVIAGLNLGPVNLAGHSMGALIAGGLAVTQPHLVRRVALLNGVYRRDAAARDAVMARAAEICAGMIDIETPLARWFDDKDASSRAQVAGWLQAVDPEGYATAYSAFAQGDATYTDEFSSIMCPFLAMTGDGDPNSTPAMSQAMAACVRDGCAVVVNGHRHMINLTAAAEVNAHLLSWLKQPIKHHAEHEVTQ